MTEDSEKNPKVSLDKTGEFFNVGTPLHTVRPGYVKRPADDILYETLVAGEYAYVVAPDRSGKTSLISATAARLRNNGFKVAVLDLEQIGERDGGSDAGRWYYSIAYRLSRQLRLKIDLQSWWQDHSILSNRQRLVEFYVQIVLQNIPERIVVFIDEVQCIAEHSFSEHLLASIRAAHNSRITEPEFRRLAFAMFGECDPHSLLSDPQLSPFGVSTEVRLNDFTREDLAVFASELNLSMDDADIALDRIYYWTSGQPYLSQKLARAVAREQVEGDAAEAVDRLAMQQLAGRAAISSEPQMSHLHRAAVSDKKTYEALLTTYGQIRKGITIEYDPEKPAQRRLLALGLVTDTDDGKLRVRNRLYEAVFTARWANENLPFHWRGPAIALLLVFFLIAIPFIYTQLLPRPYLRVMTDQSYDLATVSDAYLNFRSFPGHTDAANRMYRAVLENRARQATDRNGIREISKYSEILPDGLALAEGMRADFWDRAAETAMRNEQRDEALLASLEALEVATQVRRRRAAALIGDDYTDLIGTVPAQNTDGLVFDAEKVQLSSHKGAEISQWSVVDGVVTPREPWTMSALEVTPLVRRVIVDREGNVGRIGLTVNVSHARLDDIRMKLIAPSGRAAELTFSETSSAANQEIRVARSQLAPLIGESLNGTWSLSLRDESNGVAGHLMSWSLNLNSQVVVESFERGLDVPDPVERASENLWFGPDGHYAIARASQSDSARLWNLQFAQAARTIAVPANEQVLGLSANAEHLVTLSQSTVSLWRTTDGRRDRMLELGASVSDTNLSGDGQHLLVTYQSDPDTLFEVWSLESGEVIAELSVAGVPALHAIDAAATHLAVADYDHAVRIWDLRDGQQKSQAALAYQPTAILLSANGEALGAVLGDQGVAVWRTASADSPVFEDSGSGEWHLTFSPSGARFIAGNLHSGLQTYRSVDGAPIGPLIDPGMRAGPSKIIAFGGNEDLVLTAAAGDSTRFWAMPHVASATLPALASHDAGDQQAAWRQSGTIVSAVAPGGERIAFGDRSGHVHIETLDPAGALPSGGEDISFLGHQDAVMSLAFSPDGTVVTSAGADGTIRLWDARSGLPRPFYGRASVSKIQRMAFSPSARVLAVVGGQRVWLMNTETGAEITSVDLGGVHADLAFAADDQLFLGGETGALRNLYADRTGNWHLRTLWQGTEAIQRVAVAPRRQQIVLVDSLNQVRVLDPESGNVGSDVLTLPSTVNDMAFSPNESRVIFRTGRWLHRAVITPGGLLATDSMRAPKALSGSRMTFDTTRANNDAGNTGASGDRVLILARDTGVPALIELHFSYSSGPALFGGRTELLNDWAERLLGLPPSGFVHEGF